MTEGMLSLKMGTRIAVGDRIELLPDQILANEMLGAVVIPKMGELGTDSINSDFPRSIIKCFLDHGGIGATPQYVSLHQTIKQFCSKNNLKLFNPGIGIGHIVMSEIGAISPGDIIMGTDSHTTTQGALNTFAMGIGGSDLLEILILNKIWLEVPDSIKIKLFNDLSDPSSAKDAILTILGNYGLSFALGCSIEYECPINFPIFGRQTIANMSAEAGAVTAIFPYDKNLENFLTSIPFSLERTPRPFILGEDNEYKQVEELDMSTVIPMVAKPHRPNNVSPASELSDISPDQIYIGSCTNSRIEDLRIAAKIFKNNKSKIFTLISPGSYFVQQQAEKEGLIDIFLEAGCQIIYPGCNACFGGPIGLIGKGMICLSTTNRNFEGRMGGDATSEVYLSSPATAAASAVNGVITDPRDI
jgi:3-isopropylmalate/(R)-2-methylmalate dehydratase large subunit